jgi:hypothetical protein
MGRLPRMREALGSRDFWEVVLLLFVAGMLLKVTS